MAWKTMDIQELMRHASSRLTLDEYAQALPPLDGQPI